ncbi:MAG: potassium transporter [Synechococcaceae cyanobacterium SM2_3_2]|nr:potassium transporter [Synechococcaceae cyanobacterium SM2_3_2]
MDSHHIRTTRKRGLDSSSKELRRFPTPLRLVLGLAILLIIGTLLLMLPGMGQGQMLSPIEALFTATSALAVTGLSIITPVQQLTGLGQVVLLLLIQVGGVGFMVMAVVLFRLIGRRISLVERQALCDSLGLLRPEAILQLTQRVLLTVATIELIGAAFLWVHWRDQLGPGRAVFYALFHSVSAFCNAGFDLFGGLPEYPNGLPTDNVTLLILGSLIVLGGLGIPVLGDVLVFHRERRLSLHTRVTLWVAMILIVVGGLGIFLAESTTSSALLTDPWPRRLLRTTFQSISARTAGFAGVSLTDLTAPSQLLMMILMFIGAAPASMGGGITTGTFATLVLTLWGYARGHDPVQIGGRRLGTDMVRKASAVLTVSLFIVLLATWLILVTHDIDLDSALFEVISAFATCGLTLNFTSELNLFGQLVIIFMMFWGRLGALTIVLALAQQPPRQLVSFPEEQILIG